MISKKIIFPSLAVLVVGGALALNAAKVTAQTTNPFSGLVQMIAQNFNLDQTKVQAVVDQYRQQQKQNMAKNMLQRRDVRLTRLVTQGKITDIQKQAIITELAVLKTKYDPTNLKNLTPVDRKTQMQNEQNDLKAWAQSQGIDPNLIFFKFSGMGFRGGMMHQKTNLTPTPTN